MSDWARFTPARRSCAGGCRNELPDWPSVVACCDECLERVPATLRDAYVGASGAAWTSAVDEIRAWLAEHPANGDRS